MFNGQVCKRKASAVNGLSSTSLRVLIPYVYCSTHKDFYPAVICTEPAGVFRIWHHSNGVNGQWGYISVTREARKFKEGIFQLVSCLNKANFCLKSRPVQIIKQTKHLFGSTLYRHKDYSHLKAWPSCSKTLSNSWMTLPAGAVLCWTIYTKLLNSTTSIF